MSAYQDRPARQTSGPDERARTLPGRSALRPDCGHPSITPSLDFDTPPPNLKPLPVHGGRISGVPAFFSNRKACKETFGEVIAWTLCDRSTHDHIAMYCHDSGQPRCLDTATEIARETGHGRQSVIDSLAKLEKWRIIRIDDAKINGRQARVIWLKTALRDDLPELSGVDRDDPDCTEPHRPAYGLFADDDAPMVYRITEQPIQGAPPSKARALSQGAPPSKARALAQGARLEPGRALSQGARPGSGRALSADPAFETGMPVAQPGSGADLAPISGGSPEAGPGAGGREAVAGGAYVTLTPKEEEENVTCKAPPAGADPDPDRLRWAERAIAKLNTDGIFVYIDYVDAGIVVRAHYVSRYAERLTPGQVGRLEEHRAELVVALGKLGREGPPRNVVLAATPEAITTPVAIRPAPAAEPAWMATSAGRKVVELHGSGDESKVAEVTNMMIDFTKDERASTRNPRQRISLNAQRKWATKVITGEVPIEVFGSAMEDAMSATADKSVAVYFRNLKKWEEGCGKTGRPGVSPKSPGRPEPVSSCPA